MKLKGIDVSYCDKNVDWTKVKSDGINYAIIRAGYGREISQKDAMFEKHYSGAKSVGIPLGAYWYSYAMSKEDAIKEAKACIEIIKNKQFEYPIYFDIEESKQFALGKTICSEMCKAFCDTLEQAGYWAGIYASASRLKNYISSEVTNRYAIWVAHYTSAAAPSYGGQYGIWQYTSSGKVNGITGVSGVDMDWCYVDYPTKIKQQGLNGFSTKETTTDTFNLELISVSTIQISKGCCGGAVKTLQILLKYKFNKNIDITENFDENTEKVVKEIQESFELTPDGVVGENTWKIILN